MGGRGGSSGMGGGSVPSSVGRHVVSNDGGSVIYSVDSDSIYIDNVVVDENNRQRGIGTTLLNRVKSMSNSTGKPIELFASPTEGDMSTRQLVDWYKKNGFEITQNYGSMGARMKYTPRRRR